MPTFRLLTTSTRPLLQAHADSLPVEKPLRPPQKGSLVVREGARFLDALPSQAQTAEADQPCWLAEVKGRPAKSGSKVIQALHL